LADVLREDAPATVSNFALGGKPLNMEDAEMQTILEALCHFGERQKAACSPRPIT
jgi:hypothetical protein